MIRLGHLVALLLFFSSHADATSPNPAFTAESVAFWLAITGDEAVVDDELLLADIDSLNSAVQGDLPVLGAYSREFKVSWVYNDEIHAREMFDTLLLVLRVHIDARDDEVLLFSALSTTNFGRLGDAHAVRVATISSAPSLVSLSPDAASRRDLNSAIQRLLCNEIRRHYRIANPAYQNLELKLHALCGDN